jgi:serine/threonine protein kinase
MNVTTRQDSLLALLQGVTQGEFEVERELGRGGMAAIFLAREVALNRRVAIKTMLPELSARPAMVERFKREAQMAAGLSHPHIIQIHSVKETPDLVFFVMKFIEGRSIDSVLSERGTLDLETTRLVLQQAGSALSFAHHRGVIHRDVKPANIMIDENGWAVVTDFGIARIEDAQTLTATGTAIGTPHYMAPEQFHNKPATGASDQYALAIVAYEMLTGKKPFDGGTVAEIITHHLFSPPPDVTKERPDLPPDVSNTIVRMLAKEPASRFPDLDSAIAAFGHPDATRLDMTRAQLMAIARSGEQKKPRLSAPMSPVPVTRPSAQPTHVLPSSGPVPARTPAPATIPPASRAASAPVEAPPSRGARVAFWIVVVALVLAYPGWLALDRFVLKPAASPDRNASLARGAELWQQGQRTEAQIELSRAARELPASALPHVYLARVARESGDLETARAEAGRAVQLEPNNALALREMGSIMLAQGNYDVARRFFVRTLRASPGDRAAMGWLGCTLSRLGQTDQAARWLQRAGAGAWSSCAR